MANLPLVTVEPDGKYHNLKDLLGLDLLPGVSYSLQVVQGRGVRGLRSKDEPLDGGFVILNDRESFFTFTLKDGESFYLFNFGDTSAILNIDVDSDLDYKRIIGGLKTINKAYIDTGLTLDGSYTFETTGYTLDGFQSVLVGAYESNQMRTELKMLGSSNKMQACWPTMTEMTYSVTEIDCRQMFTARISAQRVEFIQGDVIYARDLTNTSSIILSDTPILLFNETPDGNFNNGVISEVKIWDGNKNLIRHFQAYQVKDEYVMVDVANNYQIYRPVVGSLVEA